MLQARQLTACSCRHQVQHSRSVSNRSPAAFRPAQPQPVVVCTKEALISQSASSACGTVAGSSTACSRSSRAASVVCRDAPRPMWAAKQPPEPPKGSGSAMAKMITTRIAQKCDSITDLFDIYDEWGGSFDYIHAAAALVKCGKVPGGARSSLVDKLCSTWLTQLPQAEVQACTNVLWASGRLGLGAVQRVWGDARSRHTRPIDLMIPSNLLGS